MNTNAIELGRALTILEAHPAPPTAEERRAAWLEDRKSCITGTEVSAILSLNHFSSPISVYCEKTGQSIFVEHPWMRAGKRFERAILEEYAESNGVDLQFADPYQLIRVPGFDLLGATLDATRADDGRPVDAKNLRFKDAYEVDAQGMATGFGEEGSDHIPTYYALQLHVQMMAKEKQVADLACCFTGQDFQTFTVHRDPEIDEMLKAEVAEWWAKHILGGVAPNPDGSESYGEYLKKKFARSGEVMLEPDAAMIDLVSALRIRKDELAAAEIAKDQVEQTIKEIVGTAAGIKGLLSWKNNKDSVKTDWQAVAHMLRPEVDADYFAQTVTNFTESKPGARVFRLSK